MSTSTKRKARTAPTVEPWNKPHTEAEFDMSSLATKKKSGKTAAPPEKNGECVMCWQRSRHPTIDGERTCLNLCAAGYSGECLWCEMPFPEVGLCKCAGTDKLAWLSKVKPWMAARGLTWINGVAVRKGILGSIWLPSEWVDRFGGPEETNIIAVNAWGWAAFRHKGEWIWIRGDGQIRPDKVYLDDPEREHLEAIVAKHSPYADTEREAQERTTTPGTKGGFE